MMRCLKNLRKPFKGILGSRKEQEGYSLIEVLVGVAILGVVGVGFLSALSSGYLALILADEKTMAEALTRTEFEDIRSLPFDADAVGYTDTELGYDIVVSVVNVDDSGSPSPIQKWTVSVSHDGSEVLTTSSYKVDPNRNL
ncbi:MAG: hypothetical protein A2Y72_00230 [Chloroflexi bacterium RBG_13_53_26]|nr:MAG: hypothetical protein A2Y72_00230 [Chloroflexi bacterium RBG_13_53_26]